MGQRDDPEETRYVVCVCVCRGGGRGGLQALSPHEQTMIIKIKQQNTEFQTEHYSVY